MTCAPKNFDSLAKGRLSDEFNCFTSDNNTGTLIGNLSNTLAEIKISRKLSSKTNQTKEVNLLLTERNHLTELRPRCMKEKERIPLN